MTRPRSIAIAAEPLSTRPCVGLGVEADAAIYDDINRWFGVEDRDLELWERRLRALRPGVARIFFPLDAFSPSGDTATFTWDSDAMRQQLRNLAVLREAGAAVHVCMSPWTNARMMEDGSEEPAVALVDHLVNKAGCDHVTRLSLFNEPDGMYAHDSEAYRRVFANRKEASRPWSDYVDKHRRALDLLAARGLGERVRLVVGDAVHGPVIRRERLALCREAFDASAVGFSFHHYGAEYPGFYDHPDSADYAPPPGGEEMRGYREIVGPSAELACWEFNNPGYGFGVAWTGSGPRGEDHLGTFPSAVMHTRKVLTMLAQGIDGVANWCLGDMFYWGAEKMGPMYFGLWRYKWEQWAPRPYYFYYAALVHAFRPGDRIHAVEHLPDGLCGAAASSDQGTKVALLNHGGNAVDVAMADAAGATVLRISRDRLPMRPDSPGRATPEDDMPLDRWEPLGADGALRIDPGELAVVAMRTDT